jgi:hypothetical protein
MSDVQRPCEGFVKVCTRTAYPKPSTGAEFDFGGGYMFTPRIGLGISFTGQAHKDTAGLAITVPHPFFFNSSDTAAAETQEELERAEGGAHISACRNRTREAGVRPAGYATLRTSSLS